MTISGDYFTIRTVDETELAAIYEVYRQCEDFLSLGPVPTASRQMVLDDFKLSREEGGTYCGIFTDGEMAGVVDFVPGGYHGVAENAYLALLMISSSHRGKGLGRDVVQAVEREIRKNKDVTAILSGVQTNNPSAIGFWQRMGYQIVSAPRLLPDTTICYDLKKKLLFEK